MKKKINFLAAVVLCLSGSLSAVPVPAEITRIIAEPPPRVIKIGKKPLHYTLLRSNGQALRGRRFACA